MIQIPRHVWPQLKQLCITPKKTITEKWVQIMHTLGHEPPPLPILIFMPNLGVKNWYRSSISWAWAYVWLGQWGWELVGYIMLWEMQLKWDSFPSGLYKGLYTVGRRSWQFRPQSQAPKDRSTIQFMALLWAFFNFHLEPNMVNPFLPFP